MCHHHSTAMTKAAVSASLAQDTAVTCPGCSVMMLALAPAFIFSQTHTTTQSSCSCYNCHTKTACLPCARGTWECRLDDSSRHEYRVNCLAGLLLQCIAACVIVATAMVMLRNRRKAAFTFITTAEVTLPCSLNISFSFSSLTESGRFLTYTLVKCDSRSTGLSDFFRKGPTYTFCPAKSMPLTCPVQKTLAQLTSGLPERSGQDEDGWVTCHVCYITNITQNLSEHTRVYLPRLLPIDVSVVSAIYHLNTVKQQQMMR